MHQEIHNVCGVSRIWSMKHFSGFSWFSQDVMACFRSTERGFNCGRWLTEVFTFTCIIRCVYSLASAKYTIFIQTIIQPFTEDWQPPATWGLGNTLRNTTESLARARFLYKISDKTFVHMYFININAQELLFQALFVPSTIWAIFIFSPWPSHSFAVPPSRDGSS